jgi:hypothetical protein
MIADGTYNDGQISAGHDPCEVGLHGPAPLELNVQILSAQAVVVACSASKPDSLKRLDLLCCTDQASRILGIQVQDTRL